MSEWRCAGSARRSAALSSPQPAARQRPLAHSPLTGRSPCPGLIWQVLGEEEATLEVATKGLSTVAELGERLAEEMVTTLNIEDAFKLYYVDNEGDTMLVSAHTALRDLIYSELITAKVDDYALPAPTPPPTAPKPARSSSRKGRQQAQPADGGEGEGEEGACASDNLLARSGGDSGGKKKKKRGGPPRAAPSWDS